MKGLKKYICFAIVILSALAFVLTSCGGGGGDNPPVVLLTKDNAAKAGSAAIQSLALVELVRSAYFIDFIYFDLLGNVEASNVSSKTSKSSLKHILNKAVSISKTLGDKSGMHKAGTMSDFPVNCPDGGFYFIKNAKWDGPNDGSEVNNYSADITSLSPNACEEIPRKWEGSMHVAFKGLIEEPTEVTITISTLKYTNTDFNIELTMTNLIIVLTGNPVDVTETIPTDSAMTLTGNISGTIDGAPINFQLNNYTIAITDGETYSLSGNMKPICLPFSVNVTTPVTPVTLTGSLLDGCPTAGEIIIKSGAEIKNVKTVIEADTKINIYYDNTPVTGSPYPSCTNIAGLCGG